MKFLYSIFDVEYIENSPSEALTIIKATIFCSIYVIIFNPIRGYAIKENIDPENSYRVINSSDNIVLAVVLLSVYIACKKVKNKTAIIILLCLLRIVYSVSACEYALFMKNEIGMKLA